MLPWVALSVANAGPFVRVIEPTVRTGTRTPTPDRRLRPDRHVPDPSRSLLAMNVLVALFSIASLIWLVPVIQRGRLLAIAMLVLAVGTVLGPYFFAIDGPIQFSLDRILWIAMFGCRWLDCVLVRYGFRRSHAWTGW